MEAGQKDAGNLIATPAYYVLVVGIALAVVEWRREEKEEDVAQGLADNSRTLIQTVASKRMLGFRTTRKAPETAPWIIRFSFVFTVSV